MSAIYQDLEGKHVLVTGGANGIGEGIVRAFARQRARVSVLDRDAERGYRLARELEAESMDVAFHEVDLVDEARLVETLRTVRAASGPVEVLVNNAGQDPRYEITRMTMAEWEALFRVNVGHYFVTCREVIPDMISASGGSIILTTSHQVWIGSGDLTCYTATKAAIVGMARSLAREVGRHSIRVNAIAPGWVMTERQLREHVTPEAKEKLAREQQILPFLLEPADLAEVFLFLASDASRAITRQTLVVDAGQAMA